LLPVAEPFRTNISVLCIGLEKVCVFVFIWTFKANPKRSFESLVQEHQGGKSEPRGRLISIEM